MAEALGLEPKARPDGPLELLPDARQVRETARAFERRAGLIEQVRRFIGDAQLDHEQEQAFLALVYDLRQGFKVALVESMRGDRPPDTPGALQVFLQTSIEETQQRLSGVLSEEQLALLDKRLPIPGMLGVADLVQPE